VFLVNFNLKLRKINNNQKEVRNTRTGIGKFNEKNPILALAVCFFLDTIW
jgi:hypothetical protein